MNKIDLEHKLLKGSVIYLGNIPTYKATIGQMVDFQYGYSMCQQIIGILCMDDEKTDSILSGDVEHTTWNFIVAKIFTELVEINQGQISKSDYELLLITTLPLFLSIVFGDNVTFDVEQGVFSIGENGLSLSQDNYPQFRDILKERNCLMNLDGVDNTDNPANEMTKKLLEKRKKLRDKVKRGKHINGDDDEGLTMADLISIFAESEHMPLQEVYDKYDVYQFNNQFNRLKIMEDYQVNIKALLAGAKSDDIKLQHWLSKIKKQDD